MQNWEWISRTTPDRWVILPLNPCLSFQWLARKATIHCHPLRFISILLQVSKSTSSRMLWGMNRKFWSHVIMVFADRNGVWGNWRDKRAARSRPLGSIQFNSSFCLKSATSQGNSIPSKCRIKWKYQMETGSVQVKGKNINHDQNANKTLELKVILFLNAVWGFKSK